MEKQTSSQKVPKLNQFWISTSTSPELAPAVVHAGQKEVCETFYASAVVTPKQEHLVY